MVSRNAPKSVVWSCWYLIKSKEENWKICKKISKIKKKLKEEDSGLHCFFFFVITLLAVFVVVPTGVVESFAIRRYPSHTAAVLLHSWRPLSALLPRSIHCIDELPGALVLFDLALHYKPFQKQVLPLDVCYVQRRKRRYGANNLAFALSYI